MLKIDKQLEINERAERIESAINYLTQKIEEIEKEGELAERGVKVARYIAKGTKNRYWYYQLVGEKAIFPKAKKENEFSRYQHLGVAGSSAHINGVLSVVRRKQIEELKKAIDELKQSWLDLYSSEKKVGNRAD
jgi:hypothetical protein